MHNHARCPYPPKRIAHACATKVGRVGSLQLQAQIGITRLGSRKKDTFTKVLAVALLAATRQR